jgi:hypothetical protein
MARACAGRAPIPMQGIRAVEYPTPPLKILDEEDPAADVIDAHQGDYRSLTRPVRLCDRPSRPACGVAWRECLYTRRCVPGCISRSTALPRPLRDRPGGRPLTLSLLQPGGVQRTGQAVPARANAARRREYSPPRHLGISDQRE